jgi:hypothetical protein
VASIKNLYTQTVGRKLKGYYANWEPSRPIALGDYGYLEGKHFERIGSLRSLNVAWAESVDPRLSHKKFTSSGSVSAKLTAKGKAATSKARLEVAFGKANAVFVDAAGCSYSMIEDKRALGVALKANGTFDRKWVVVTDLLKAKRSIVAISATNGASVTFEADASVDAIDLADASIGLGAKQQSSIGYLVDAQKGLAPFFGLCGFRHLFPPKGEGLRSLSIRSGADVGETDDSTELVFAQL